MEESRKLELISLAIEKLMEDSKTKQTSAQTFGKNDDDDQQLLSRLLSQIESLESEKSMKQREVSTQSEELASVTNAKMEALTEGVGEFGIGKQEIVKELKKVKSQIESLESEESLVSAQSEEIASESDPKTEATTEGGGVIIGKQEIVKELKKLKKQNFVTHCLLSAMIVVTLVWQLSEVSLILKVKSRVSHPLQTIGCLVRGMIKGPEIKGLDEEKKSSSSSSNQNQTEFPAIPPLKFPDLPILELPDLVFNADDN